MQFGKLVDKAWEDKTAREVLNAPPSALEGLTEKHDEALKAIGIRTVGDLGRWKYATRAAALVALADLDANPLDEQSVDANLVQSGSMPSKAFYSVEAIVAPSDDGQRLTLTIYTSGSADVGRAIRDAILELAVGDRISVEALGPELPGSWLQRLTLRAKYQLESPESQEAIAAIKVAIENAALNERQAVIDGHKADSAAKLATAFAGNDEVVVVLGTLVFVKASGRVVVRSIDAVTASRIEKSNDLLGNPTAVLRLITHSSISDEPQRELPAG